MIREMETFLKLAEYKSVADRLDIEARLVRARERLTFVETDEYMRMLEGTIGADPNLVSAMVRANA